MAPTSARAYLLLSPLHIRLLDAFEERISWLFKKKKKKTGGQLVYTAWFALFNFVMLHSQVIKSELTSLRSQRLKVP